MKALLVSHSETAGGAARATSRLHDALRAAGIESTRMVRRGQSVDTEGRGGPFPRIVSYAQIRAGIESRFLRLQRTTNTAPHSADLLPSRWSASINSSNADIVNLHWIGAGTMSIGDVGRIRLPIVMTLHDMWGFCGSEHYASEKAQARWRVGYDRGNRTEGHRGLDLDGWTWQRKKRSWRPVTVICPSRWLASCARQSALMAGWPIHVVPNVLDTTVFHKFDRANARHRLGLPLNSRLVAFGAVGGSRDPRKGFDLLVEALPQIGTNARPVVGIVFGQSEPKDPPRVGVPLQWLGRIEDDTTLALLYSAVDVMVVPSRQENLPQTATEALACGTPVVGFDATGLRDAVSHQETGYLAEPFSTSDLARGISWVLADDIRRAALGSAARRRAIQLWKPSVVVDRYLDVYQEAIERPSGIRQPRQE